MAKVHIGTRVEPALIERLDRLAAALAARTRGADLHRSDAARAALERGLALYEKELGLGAGPSKAGKGKATS